MPKKLQRCLKKVRAKIKAGKMPAGSNEYAICVASTGQKPHRRKRKKHG